MVRKSQCFSRNIKKCQAHIKYKIRKESGSCKATGLLSTHDWVIQEIAWKSALIFKKASVSGVHSILNKIHPGNTTKSSANKILINLTWISVFPSPFTA